MNEVDLRRAQSRAAKADKLFNDKLMQEALSKMEADLFKLWKMSVAEDVDGRERIYYQFRSMDIFRQSLISYMKEGKLAEDELAQIMKRETAKWQSRR